MKPGETYKLEFATTAAHAGHFWKIYISKPGFDSASEQISWDDLELLTEYDEIEPEKTDDGKAYFMDVTIPEGREGTGVILVRWQRIDSAGEGFYNVSDIAFSEDAMDGNGDVDEGGSDDNVDGGDDSGEKVAVGDLGAFVNPSHAKVVEAGDTVRFRLLKTNDGSAVIDYSMPITQNNQDISQWAVELGDDINLHYDQQVDVGVLNEVERSINFDPANIYKNRVWAPVDTMYTLDIIEGQDPVPAGHWDPAVQYAQGSQVEHNGFSWVAQWYQNPGEEPGVADVWKNVTPGIHPWNSGLPYEGGSQVSHGGKNWEAAWYAEPGQEPGVACMWEEI